MRNLLTILILLPTMLFANEDLKEANKLYEAKQYKTALESYSNLLDSSKQQPSLYYNIGNCHARLENLGLSILYFEKALLYNPNHVSAKKNLVIQEELVEDDLGARPVTSSLNKLARIPKGNFWNWLGLGFSMLAGICFLVGFKKKKSSLHLLGVGLIIVCGVSMYLSYEQYDSWSNSKYGVVLQNTSLKTGKDAESKESYLVNEGVKMEVVSSDDEWTQVLLNEETLWVPNVYFKKI